VRRLALFLVLGALAGCSKQPAPNSAEPGKAPDALTQKLQSMTPEQRAEYARTHMDEITASAGLHSQAKNP
jgi:hypothetical protein